MFLRPKQFRLASMLWWFLLVAISLGAVVTFRQVKVYRSETRQLIDSYVQKRWLSADLRTYSTKYLAGNLWRIDCKKTGQLFLKNAEDDSYTSFSGDGIKGEGVLEFSRIEDDILEANFCIDGAFQSAMSLTAANHKRLMAKVGFEQGNSSDDEVMVLDFGSGSGVVLRRCE